MGVCDNFVVPFAPAHGVLWRIFRYVFGYVSLCAKKHMACREKYKPYILKYKALISKYMPCIFGGLKPLKYNDL